MEYEISFIQQFQYILICKNDWLIRAFTIPELLGDY